MINSIICKYKGSLQLPIFLEDMINKGDKLGATTHIILSDLSNWIDCNPMFFFPEYTEHGVQHVNHVLHSAVELMNSKSKKIVSVEDACVLCLAAILHDSAMHINLELFRYLVKGEYGRKSIEYISEESWNDLWEDYTFEVRHWDEKTYESVLGKKSPICNCTRFGHDLLNLTDTDRLIIGEFLRRNHHRLAHHFAVFGFPFQSDGQPSVLDKSLNQLPQHYRDIAGLIARSHGVPLRKCYDILQENPYNMGGRKECWGTHPIYLMILLRIADYIQIQSGRSGLEYLYVSSPGSRIQHLLHKAITGFSNSNDDPDMLFIQCQPENASVFLSLRNLFIRIQKEIDSSWAILGEVYGRHPKLKSLGLSIRRIRSDIDDVDLFSKRVQYLPNNFAVGVSVADLLKLLVRPFYGNRPEIGIRELIQNSVDAVRERVYYEYSHPESKDSQHILQSIGSDVEVMIDLSGSSKSTLSNDKNYDIEYGTLIVTDKGIGMSVETIQKYYLIAGASYRTSLTWKREFEKENPVGMGIRSSVNRAGRFGIGMLTGFLLGDRISVVTRHISSQYGLSFEVGLHQDTINVSKDYDAPIGTTIKIDVPIDTCYELIENDNEWDWYCYKKPCVKRKLKLPLKYTPTYIIDIIKEIPRRHKRIDGNQQSRIIDFKQVYEFDEYPSDNRWRRIASENFRGIYWDIADCSIFVCSGILIIDYWDHEHNGYFYRDGTLRFYPPTISVIDSDGIMSLNAARDDFDWEEQLFYIDLIKDLALVFIATLLMTHEQDIREFSIDKSKAALRFNIPFIRDRDLFKRDEDIQLEFLGMKDGFIPALVSLTSLLQITSIIVMIVPKRVIKKFTSTNVAKKFPDLMSSSNSCLVVSYSTPSDKAVLGFSQNPSEQQVFQLSMYNSESGDGDEDLNVNIEVPLQGIRVISRPRFTQQRKGKTNSTSIRRLKGLSIVDVGYCPDMNLDNYLEYITEDILIVEAFIDLSRLNSMDMPISSVWQEYVGQRPIPYSASSRFKTLESSFVRLEDIITKLSQLETQGKCIHHSKCTNDVVLHLQ